MNRDDRYWAKVDRRGVDECWPWTAFRNPFDYGMFRGGDEQLAHRYGYRLAFGTIPVGMCVCHHCDNPPCQNPQHFFLGTPGDNSADKVSKNRQARVSRPGSLNPMARFTEQQVAAIRSRYSHGETQERLAAEYDVAQSHISRIVRGAQWGHLGEIPKVDGRFRKPRGERHHQATLTDEQVGAMRSMHANESTSYAELGRRFGVSDTHARDIVLRLSRA